MCLNTSDRGHGQPAHRRRLAHGGLRERHRLRDGWGEGRARSNQAHIAREPGSAAAAGRAPWAAGLPLLRAQQSTKLLDVQLRVPDELTEQAGLQGGVVGNRQGLAGSVLWMEKPHVASALPDNLIPEAFKDANSLPGRDDRKLRAHRVTTTLPTRTREGSGMSSPSSCMTSRHSSMASLMLARASSIVSPWL